MKPGRPTRFTPDLAIKLICLVDDGMTRKAAAARVGIGERTLHDWQARGRRGDPDFRFWMSELEAAADRARRRRCREAWKRYEARAKERWRELKQSRERWWLDWLGPQEFSKRRLNRLVERGKWEAYGRLVTDLAAWGFRVLVTP
jgi:transposase